MKIYVRWYVNNTEQRISGSAPPLQIGVPVVLKFNNTRVGDVVGSTVNLVTGVFDVTDVFTTPNPCIVVKNTSLFIGNGNINPNRTRPIPEEITNTRISGIEIVTAFPKICKPP